MRGACLLVVLLALGAGCSPSRVDRTEDGRVVVDYWEMWTGFEGEAMQEVVDDFNASQDRIFVKKLTVSQLDQKLMLATAGGNPPDVSGLISHQVNDFAEKGALTPLDGYLREAGITREAYAKVFWDLCEHRGFMWALPTTPATVALHWNKKLFREAGLDPDRPPRTLAELDEMAKRLTIVRVERDGETVDVPFLELSDEEREEKEFELIQVGHLPQEPGWWRELFGFWFGATLWDGDRRITATHEGNIRAFDWVQGYAEQYGVDNLRSFGASVGTFSSPQNPFLTGQVAMVMQGV